MVRIPEEARLCSHAPVSFAPFLGKPFKRVLPRFLPVSLCCRGRRRLVPTMEETQTAASRSPPRLVFPRSRVIYFSRRLRDGATALPTPPSPFLVQLHHRRVFCRRAAFSCILPQLHYVPRLSFDALATIFLSSTL